VATFLLDTDILSLYQRNHPKVRAAVAAHAADVVSVSTVTVEEQIGGWSALARSAKTPQEHEHAAMFLAALVVSWAGFALVPLTISAMSRFEALAKAIRNVKRNDLRNAAIAVELGATVVTRNRRDFGRVPGLVIEDWSVQPDDKRQEAPIGGDILLCSNKVECPPLPPSWHLRPIPSRYSPPMIYFWRW